MEEIHLTKGPSSYANARAVLRLDASHMSQQGLETPAYFSLAVPGLFCYHSTVHFIHWCLEIDCYFKVHTLEFQWFNCQTAKVGLNWVHQHLTKFSRGLGGRTWQAFGGGKNGHETFCQARIYNFRDKCVVFARNRKFATLTQKNMQYILCNSAQKTLRTKKALFLPKDIQKVRKSRQILICVK